jgi:hypothetical protein
MARVNESDAFVRRPRRSTGLIAGVSIAILAAVLTYLDAQHDPYGLAPWGAFIFGTLWVGPVLAAAVLAVMPKTRSVAGGLAQGTLCTWIISIPTLVSAVLMMSGLE